MLPKTILIVDDEEIVRKLVRVALKESGNADFLLFGFLKSSGLQVAKVPYRDILQAPNDLAEGRIQALMTSLAVVRPQMQAGRVKVLALTTLY